MDVGGRRANVGGREADVGGRGTDVGGHGACQVKDTAETSSGPTCLLPSPLTQCPKWAAATRLQGCWLEGGGGWRGVARGIFCGVSVVTVVTVVERELCK